MPKRFIGITSIEASYNRLFELYQQGHRLIVSFSGGKDSTVLLEIARMAARAANRLPVEAIMRDEEIMFPGTFEYVERIYNDPEINLTWAVANNPVMNVYDRTMPYFWTFDPDLDPDDWVRKPPPYATYIEDIVIERMTVPERFPPPEGKELCAVIGIRAGEARGRLMGIYSSGGHKTKINRHGVRNVRPIYDVTDGDVWRFIADYKVDYNRAYDVMARHGFSRAQIRVAPPTLSTSGFKLLKMAANAWPTWFSRVKRRLRGVDLVVAFGKDILRPHRKLNESWQECFIRTCIDDAPVEWIAERSMKAMQKKVREHSLHSSDPLPDGAPCPRCSGKIRSWRGLALNMYNGDPFGLAFGPAKLPPIPPTFFKSHKPGWGKGNPHY